jgi:hypothetical protein
MACVRGINGWKKVEMPDEFRTGGNEEMRGGAKPSPELMAQYSSSSP